MNLLHRISARGGDIKVQKYFNLVTIAKRRKKIPPPLLKKLAVRKIK